jgi:hypothetical protein
MIDYITHMGCIQRPATRGKKMRIQHKSGYSFIQGKVSEQAKILKVIAAANCEVIVDECDEDETSYTVVSKSPYTTQAERQADFQHAKRR